MTALRRRLPGLLGLALVLAAVRGPLHRTTHALPVSNDDAIPLLIARQLLRGEITTILWNQPYNGTLDAYLLAPGLLVADPHAVFRAYEAACGVLLTVAAGLLGSRVAGAAAGWGAAALAAVGTPYMALMAATGPTPNFLVPLLVGFPLLAGFRRLDGGGGEARGWATAAWGLVCGVGVWDSALALPALAGSAAGLWLSGLRPRRSSLLLFMVGLAAGLSPLGVARLSGASASSAVTAVRPRWLWGAGLHDLARAGAGLLGLEVPLVVDGPERAAIPVVLWLSLAAGLFVLVLAGSVSRRALPLLGWAGALAVTFAFSRRTGGDEIRYLFGMTLPTLALAGAGFDRLWTWRRPAAASALVAVVVPWIAGDRILVERWSDPSHAVRVWQVPPLGPVLSTLERAQVRSAYASLQFAGRLAIESGGAVVASQAWNERIPGDPLRFRDEVDLDPRAAWVLSPHLSRGMPRAGGFRELLSGLGGTWREDLPGDLVVFRRFQPPYDESRPVPVESFSVSSVDGATLPPVVLDRDVGTAWRSPFGIGRGYGLRAQLDRPRRLSALVVAVDLERSPLGVPWVAELDGAIVARGPAPHGLQWVNGVPRSGKQALLAVPLGDRAAADVRLIFQGAGPPLIVSEVFLYGPDEGERPAAGAQAAADALERARAGDWDAAVARYTDAARLEPGRASYHAALARAAWRASHRRWLDVESLDDGGAGLVTAGHPTE